MEDVKKRKSYSLYDTMLFQENVISKWRPSSEVWPFLHGDDILGCLTAIGGIVVTYFFRKQLNLRAYAKLTCYLPVVGPPALCSQTFHSYVITTDILQANACSLCITTKAALAQAAIGVGFPLLIAPTICFYMADRILTYPVPPLLKAPKECFLLFQKFVRKNPRQFFVIGAIQMIATSFITYQKQKSLINIDTSLNKKRLN